MVYRKLPDLPYSVAPLVRDLPQARHFAINVQMAVRSFSPCYIAAEAFTKAVDRVAGKTEDTQSCFDRRSLLAPWEKTGW